MSVQNAPTKTTGLSNDTLSALPLGVEGPRYDRSKISPGIVHIGMGNFHRAHQAWYLHRLMQNGLALDWGIIGAGVRPYDAQQRQKMQEQDFLTTLIQLDPVEVTAEVIGSIIDYVPVEEGNAPLIAQMADQAIRIVALTVTEGGYYIDPVTGGVDLDHEDIRHDAANPTRPRTAFGAIIAALGLRRASGAGPFTLQSCDNLQGNGEILRRVVIALAELSDPDLADWIGKSCSFPNSMVDCIVPATGPNEFELVRGFGIDDAVPVTHERFRQWVIEDEFCAGRPDWDKVGATFSRDVHAYEAMKIRILNGGHQLLANAGEVLSIATIAECMSHPQIGQFFQKVANEEIVPHVAPVPGLTPTEYVNLIAERFANPRIVDTTRRVAFDGSARHTGFILPVIRAALDAGTPITGLALAEALWARMCAGIREDGSTIQPNDPMWTTLNEAAIAAKSEPMAWLRQAQIYGELSQHAEFAGAFCSLLAQIWREGAEVTMKDYLKS